MLPTKAQVKASAAKTPRKKAAKTPPLAPLKQSRLAKVSKFTNDVDLSNIIQIEEVLTCVKIISECVALMPITIKQRLKNGSIKTLDSHPLAKLLRVKANPYTTAYEFKQWLLIDYLTANFGCAIITRDQNGDISGLWQQNAKNVSAFRDKNYDLCYNVKLDLLNEPYTFPQADFFRVINFNNTGILGNNITELAQNTLQTASATTKFAKDFFEQGIMPDGFIELSDAIPDSETSAIVKDELQRDLESKYAGTGKFHSALLLPNGAKFVQIQNDLQKMQAVETRKFNRQVIGSMFRVVPFLLGENGGAGTEEQWQSQVKNLLPIITNFESAINAQLLTDAEIDAGIYVKFNADALERGNINTRFSAYATAVNNGIMTVNEVRRKEDLPPVEGGDELRQNSAIQSIDHSKNAGGSNENSTGTDNNGNLIEP